MHFFFTMLYILTPLLFFRLFCYRIIDSGEIKIFKKNVINLIK